MTIDMNLCMEAPVGFALDAVATEGGCSISITNKDLFQSTVWLIFRSRACPFLSSTSTL